MATNTRQPIYVNGEWEIDLSRRELRSRGVPVALGGRAFEIIETLVESAGMLVTKEELMASVWPGAAIEDNTLQVHISAVRRAFGADRGMLTTAFGRGYRLLGDWTARDDDTPLSQAEPPLPPAPLPRDEITTNLPLAPSELIGRADAVRQLRDLLSIHRVVTLTGPGGIGKTALAMETARSLLLGAQSEIWSVELMALADPDLVPTAVAGVLGLQPGGGAPSAESVARAIGRRKMLLLLDNCEHLIDAAARLAETVVRACPRASILATTREVLRIDGECVFRVPPLDVPALDSEAPADVLSHSAVHLFIARTRMRNQDFSPRGVDMPLIANICRRLEGIPLAIEFAAARAAVLGLHEVATRLDDRFDLLTDGRRTALPRHQTLRATLDWSYDLLPAAEQRILRRLAVFPGGFTLDAAAAVMTPDGGGTVIDGIANLVAKSLVTLDAATSAERWRLLDTVRAYAQEKLAETGEAEGTARRQAEYFLAQLTNDHADGEIDNIRAALDWAFSQSGDSRLAIDLTVACVPLWTRLSLLGECRTRVEAALAVLNGAGKPRAELTLRAALGMALTYTSGPIDAAKPNWQRVRDLADTLNDTEYQLRSVYGLCLHETLICEHRVALALAQQFQQIAAATAELPTADRMMAIVLHYLGDQAGACEYAERSLAAPPPPDRDLHAARYGVDQRVGALVQLARALWLRGFPDQAMATAQAAVDEATDVAHANSVCLALADGACIVAILCGDLSSATRFATALTEHADRHALGVWRTYGRALRGRLMINDQPLEGVALLRSALDELHDTPFDIRFQLYLVWLAEVLGAAGQASEALRAIDDALERAERTEERWYLPEILRIRGELSADANYFARSLQVAREQNALSWELRAAASQVRGRHAEPALLGATLARFTEGFSTADLLAA
ncbi:MAG TPA: winged helix-turn-helix domain-containing protein, partial [Acetobacteraceae bacterium]|nr:winged helix-turn-helix domain-containing protein [Acetobacteraceae bacterium]